MTRDEAVNVIKRGLSFRLGTSQDDNIVAELQEAQAKAERGEPDLIAGVICPMPWFLKTYDQTLSVTADNPDVTLPTDFLAEDDGEGPYYTPASSAYPVYLRKWNQQAPNQTAPDLNQTEAFYEVRKTTLRIYPTPETAWTLYWSYFAKDSLLTSNIENTWLEYAPNVLIALAGQSMAIDLRNKAAVEKFGKLYIAAIRGIETDNFRREFNNRRIQMGGG